MLLVLMTAHSSLPLRRVVPADHPKMVATAAAIS
jgi:hypothetical protein